VQYEVEIAGRIRQVDVHRTDQTFTVSVDGRPWQVDAVRIDHHTWSLLVEAATTTGLRAQLSHEVTIVAGRAGGPLSVQVGGVTLEVAVNGRHRRRRKEEGQRGGPGQGRVVAPMPGKILRVLVKAGDAVRARQAVVVVEAMKMENELRAGHDGTVTEIHAVEGQLVDAGALLAVITAGAEQK
jgi:biotin carboxyl carrier protein